MLGVDEDARLSFRALNYVTELRMCEDGAPLDARQKLLLMMLAHYHNSEVNASWPSVPRLAVESLCDEGTARRHLKYLEKHNVLMRLKPETQGRGQLTRYVFLAIDRPTELARLLNGKGVQDATLFSAGKRVAEGVQTEPERVAEGVQNGIRYKEELELKASRNSDAIQAENKTKEQAQELWRTVSAEMLEELGGHRWDTWLKPARTNGVVDGWLQLYLPNAQFLQWVTEHFRMSIQARCERLGLRGVILLSAGVGD